MSKLFMLLTTAMILCGCNSQTWSPNWDALSRAGEAMRDRPEHTVVIVR